VGLGGTGAGAGGSEKLLCARVWEQTDRDPARGGIRIRACIFLSACVWPTKTDAFFCRPGPGR
jgi:hypothetical protein